MKFYDCQTAPSPRRVRIFLAEKGIEVPTQQVDLRNREQLTEEYMAVNPRCDVPYLVLDDGTGIGEVEAICRYFEETHPEPPLFGRDAREKALVSMWTHRFELEGYQAAAEALRNSSPAFENRALTGPDNYEQIPALAERGRARTARFLDRLDELFGEAEYAAGPTFTFADITALVAVDFAGWLKIKPDPDRHPNLIRWHGAVSARPSAKA